MCKFERQHLILLHCFGWSYHFLFSLTLSQDFSSIFHQILHNENYVNELNNDQIIINRFIQKCLLALLFSVRANRHTEMLFNKLWADLFPLHLHIFGVNMLDVFHDMFSNLLTQVNRCLRIHSKYSYGDI